jgi:hypothetical protein
VRLSLPALVTLSTMLARVALQEPSARVKLRAVARASAMRPEGAAMTAVGCDVRARKGSSAPHAAELEGDRRVAGRARCRSTAVCAPQQLASGVAVDTRKAAVASKVARRPRSTAGLEAQAQGQLVEVRLSQLRTGRTRQVWSFTLRCRSRTLIRRLSALSSAGSCSRMRLREQRTRMQSRCRLLLAGPPAWSHGFAAVRQDEESLMSESGCCEGGMICATGWLCR